MILLLDCDNTLYPASSGIMELSDRRMNRFIQQKFGLDLEETQRLRVDYLRRYGTTLKGLMLHHAVDPDEYLSFVHGYSLDGVVEPNPRLASFLRRAGIPRVVFTSANREHVEHVAQALGIADCIDAIYDLASVDYEGKPADGAYARVMADYPGERAVFVDDRLLNFPVARRAKMITVLIEEMPVGERLDAYAALTVFREEAKLLQEQRPELVDFTLRRVEELDGIWGEIVALAERQ